MLIKLPFIHLIKLVTGMLFCVFSVNASQLEDEKNNTSNLVVNPGFEIKGVNGPKRWFSSTSKRTKAVWDNRIYHSGKHSIRIEREQGAGGVKWHSDFIPVTPDSAIQISAWMKLKDVVLGKHLWNGVVLSAVFFNEDKKQIRRADISRDEGTSEWAKYEKILIPPTRTSYVKLSFYFSKTSGVAWLDDVTIIKLPEYAGKFFSVTRGSDHINIDVDVNKVIAKNSYINGIFNERPRYKFEAIEDLGPDIVRLPMMFSHHYHILKVKDNDIVAYNWSKLDRDLATILEYSAVPFIELGWVPDELESEIGNKEFARWEKIIHDLVTRYSQKYDISKWYWNFWNEPSTYRKKGGKRKKVHWYGDENDFREFYAATAKAASGANSNINIGGSGFANNSPWLKRFIKWCGENNVRMDFVSWHSYGLLPEKIVDKANSIQEVLNRYESTRNAEMIIDEWSSYTEGGQGRVDRYRKGGYASAYRISTIIEMMKSDIDANIWFNMYEKKYGVFADKVRQLTYSSFILLKNVGYKFLSLSGVDEDPYINALAGVDENGKYGVLLSYFKHVSDKSQNKVKTIHLQLHGVKASNSVYGVYTIKDTVNRMPDHSGRENLQYTTLRPVINSNGVVSINLEMLPDSVILIKESSH